MDVVVEVPYKVVIREDQERDVVAATRQKPCEWLFGGVDVANLPQSCLHYGAKFVDELNLEDTSWNWELAGATQAKPSLVFSRGSIPTHIDEITSTTLLILLYCRPWVGKNATQPYPMDQGGEFFSDCTPVVMYPGQAIVFNDCQPHAWLSNAAWAFATFPLIKLHK